MNARDLFFAGLCDLGVRARLSSEAFAPKRFGRGRSLGRIEIDLTPIQWADLSEVEGSGATLCEASLGIPDMRLAKMPETSAISITIDPDGGRDVRWTGEDLGLGMIDALNSYAALNQELRFSRRSLPLYFGQRETRPAIVINAHPQERCWTITLPVRLELSVTSLFAGRKLRVPSAEELACYREIGRLLLNSPLSLYWEAEQVSA